MLRNKTHKAAVHGGIYKGRLESQSVKLRTRREVLLLKIPIGDESAGDNVAGPSELGDVSFLTDNGLRGVKSRTLSRVESDEKSSLLACSEILKLIVYSG